MELGLPDVDALVLSADTTTGHESGFVAEYLY
jgi:hypothetical protein